jgi:hypothetical protein
VRRLAERLWFRVCLVLGGALRAGRYSTVQIACRDEEQLVYKKRAFYAPLLVSLGAPLMEMLNTGVRVLPDRAWALREQQLYLELYGKSVGVNVDGTLLLPFLSGETLASLLESGNVDTLVRNHAIELAVAALRQLHERGLTHGDAMADNVLVDLKGGVGRWFDFETIHDSDRTLTWRRTDDVRAIIMTILVRTDPEKFAEVLQRVLDVYRDPDISLRLHTYFASVFQRALIFHLGQAALSYRAFRSIDRLLSAPGHLPI